MPYLNAENVKKVRLALKAKFPKAKFSIRLRDHMALSVILLKSPVDFGQEVSRGGQINPYHYKNHDYSEAGIKMIDGIMETIQSAHPRHIESEDGDYGSIPNYYLNVSIGTYSKPYQKV